MVKLRSIRDGRAAIRNAAEALDAEYGVSDFFEFLPIARGQLQSWIGDEFVRTKRTEGGVRVFDFDALARAAILRHISSTLPRASLGQIVKRIDHELRDQSFEDALGRTRDNPLKLRFEIFGESGDAGAGPADEVTAEDLGSPIGVEISINVTRTCTRLVKHIVESGGSPNA